MSPSSRWVIALLIAAGCTPREQAPSSDSASAARSEGAGVAAALESLRERFVVGAERPDRAARRWHSDATPSARPFFGPCSPADAAIVDVDLPARGDQPMTITDRQSSVSVGVTLAGAAAEPLAAADGCAVVPRAARGAGVVALRRTPVGVEDFVLFERAPDDASLTYEIRLGVGVAGLRLVSNALELVDAGGAPRLRMAAPRLVDANGAVHGAAVRIEGCAVDFDPAPPWGRAPVDPGATSCRVIVAWDGARVAYPALLDPAWMATTSLASELSRHAATSLGDGRVLVTGGDAGGGVSLDLAQLYDPATNSWANTAPMSQTRVSHRTVRVADGRVLACGGLDVAFGSALAECELWSPVSGTWAPAAAMSTTRERFGMHVLADGRVLAFGGLDVTDTILNVAETYDAATNAWSPAGNMVDARFAFSLTELTDGRVLIAGGFDEPDAHQSVELFNPVTSTFSAGPSMAQSRGGHEGARLPDGRVLVAGGITYLGLNNTAATNLAEIYDPATNVWAPAATLPEIRYSHRMAALENGFVIAVGGQDTMLLHKTPRVYDAAADAWLAGPDMLNWRVRHTATLMADGSLLLAGGEEGGNPVSYLDTAERLRPGTPGDPCTHDFECADAHCVDAVCCDAACDGACEACTADKKGGGADGACGPVASGTDPDDDCADSGGVECQNDGTCDGAGACKQYPVQRGCTPVPCSRGAECASGFCADGVCCDTACTDECEACIGSLKGSGVEGQCGPIAKGTDPNDECGDDGSTTCSNILLCNGAGDCQDSQVVCAPYACLDSEGCKISCSSDADCAPKHRCKDDVCVPIEPECDGDQAIDENGVVDECPPYACDPGTGKCRDDCVSVADCSAPNVCADGECVPPPPAASGDDGGCGCDVPGAGGPNRSWWLVVGLIWAFARPWASPRRSLRSRLIAAALRRRRTRRPCGGRLSDA